ncbi:hypothetical protein ACGFNU_50545 [Spirillospora sp. NPDC048911]|uniref:hypothetical protein n=1 Tax=Spirillospora sp. NPDC048911 TaxID=3364527 RepID=UPI00371A12CA
MNEAIMFADEVIDLELAGEAQEKGWLSDRGVMLLAAGCGVGTPCRSIWASMARSDYAHWSRLW